MSDLDDRLDRIARLEEHLVGMSPDELVTLADCLHAAGQDAGARLALEIAQHDAAFDRHQQTE